MTPNLRLELGPGGSVVAALPGVAVLVPGESSPEPVLAVARAAASSGHAPGRDLARRLAGLLTGDEADTVPGFGAVADTGDGLLVFLYGSVVAKLSAADGEEIRLSGTEAATWVDRVLGPEQTVVVMADGSDVELTTSIFELTAGVVPAGWMRVSKAAVPAGDDAPLAVAPEPEAPASEPEAPEPVAGEPEPETGPLVAPPPIPPPPVSAPPASDGEAARATPPEKEEPATESMPIAFDSISLAPDDEPLREPLPVEAPEETAQPAAEDPGVAEHKLVDGILCSRQHFNSPDSAFCSTCGISMVHQTHNLVRRERPPLGFLVFDDGATFTLDDRYVLGREPETDPRVEQGEIRPIPLDDPQMSVSRVHAEIQLVGWDVHLVDRGSTNGTHILNASGDGWDRVPPEQATVVVPGARVALGQRTFVYETPQRHG